MTAIDSLTAFKGVFTHPVIETLLKESKFSRTASKVGYLLLTDASVAYGKKVKNKDRATYSFLFKRVETSVICFLKTERLYKYIDKRVYKVLNLVDGKWLAITQLFLSDNAKQELFLPAALRMDLSPHLMPPYQLIETFPCHQGQCQKMVAIGKLYQSNATSWSITLRFHLKAMLAAAKGEQYLQSQGYMHKDIKPDNLFVDDDGECQLGDFGSVSKIGEKRSHGTERYMAPERFKSSKTKLMSALWELGTTGLSLMGLDVNWDNFTEKKKKKQLTRDIIQQYLSELRQKFIENNSDHPALPIWLKLFGFYGGCLKLEPYERPLLPTFIRLLESVQKEIGPQKKEQNNGQGPANRAGKA
ncbi:MAG: protein kinase [Chlamydiia bacterium]|nr:protein kinase [Chlamydiia bacterium]